MVNPIVKFIFRGLRIEQSLGWAAHAGRSTNSIMRRQTGRACMVTGQDFIKKSLITSRADIVKGLIRPSRRKTARARLCQPSPSSCKPWFVLELTPWWVARPIQALCWEFGTMTQKLVPQIKAHASNDSTTTCIFMTQRNVTQCASEIGASLQVYSIQLFKLANIVVKSD